jgi:probable phosphoglycerate mutase
MLTLYFVRHAQTQWNVEGKIQGRQDSDLTEKGIRDARLLAERFRDMDWTAVYASPSRRAVRTLQLIHNGPFTTDERLMEMDLGDLEGMSMEQIKALFPKLHDHYWHQPSRYAHASGENFFDVKNRIAAFIDELIVKYESGDILIMTHGVVVKMVQILFRGLDMDQLWQTPYIDGTSVTAAKIDNGQAAILSEGDLAHLLAKDPSVH